MSMLYTFENFNYDIIHVRLPSYNWGQLQNPDTFGALHKLRNQYEYNQTQCEDDAKDVKSR